MKPIRILLIDDHELVREGLRMLIENQPNMLVVGEAGNSSDARAAAAREQPDIILLDLDLAGENSLDSLREIISVSGKSRVLVLTGVRDPEMHRRAVHLGAVGILLKDQAGKTLIKAINKVDAGEVWLDRSMTASIINDFTHTDKQKNPREAEKISSLTEREREVVALIVEGLASKRIAERLFISEKTVSNHLTAIYSKLGLSTRLELAMYAARHGFGKSLH
jgi:two-component system, NarL family, nitrate/nitrite response regulator NarL